MERLEKDNLIHPAQRGFRRLASTTDQLVIVKSVVTNYRHKKKPLFVAGKISGWGIPGKSFLKKSFLENPVSKIKMEAILP